jgi:hypothetical protein
MTALRTAATGIWECVVGDDWRIAVGVVVALGLTALVAELSPAWFVTPVAVVCLLALSVWRSARGRGRPPGHLR